MHYYHTKPKYDLLQKEIDNVVPAIYGWLSYSACAQTLDLWTWPPINDAQIFLAKLTSFTHHHGVERLYFRGFRNLNSNNMILVSSSSYHSVGFITMQVINCRGFFSGRLLMASPFGRFFSGRLLMTSPFGRKELILLQISSATLRRFGTITPIILS
jgi:hypothetical protein